jgi:CSLREA domain-containing protein/uncharacterized repeat protein (TIGR01451 family)
VQAASPIVVNSTEDNQTASDGLCTLREAINNANSSDGSDTTDGDCAAGTAGADTINFDLTGTADFTLQDRNSVTKDGYTIKLASVLPSISQPVTIDGYSQTGSLTNTQTSPQPFNSTLLVQIDGTDVNDDGFIFIDGSDDSAIRGLVINSFDTGVAIRMRAPGITVQGNYIGTDPEGMTAKPNGSGMSGQTIENGINAQIGGLNAEDRNIISGNSGAGTFSSGGYPASGWVVQGNYVGLAANGTDAIANSVSSGPGGMSIDNADDVIIGGSETGAANVFSGNSNQGMAPDHANGLRVEGNFIGTDYTGNNQVGNIGPAINLNNSSDVTIKNNVMSGNGGDGFYGDHNTRVTFQGNKIGTNVDGSQSMPNGQSGISIGPESTDFLIGGTGTGQGNVIANNGASIATNNSGINVASEDDSNISILGNSIFNNDILGIDLGSFDGVTANDVKDTDSGANDLLNFPQYTDIAESGGNTTISYELDVPAGNYRIEFFSNDTADPSGNGEGQTYLGSQDITSAGNGSQTYSKALTGTGLTNLAMTATLKDSSSPSGFGPTSEFGGPVPPITDIALSKSLDDPQDVAPGATISYTVTFTNNGPSSLDLTDFNGSGGFNTLITDAADPDLTFVSSSSSSVSCNSVGTITDIGQASGFKNHADFGVVLCDYVSSGGDDILHAGESISTHMQFQIDPSSDLHFSNYVLQVAVITNDPDKDVIESTFIPNSDAIDTLLAAHVNNVAGAVYPLPVTPSGDGDNSGQSSGGTSNPLIPNTGAGQVVLIKGLISVVLGGSLLFVLRKRFMSKKYSPK